MSANVAWVTGAPLESTSEIGPPTRSIPEVAHVFGAASGVYRVIVFGGILLVVADHFFLIGLLMAAVCFISWITIPLGKFIHYLAASPKLERARPRAIAVSVLLLGIVLGMLQFLPLPSHFRAPGIVQAREWTQVVNETPGQLLDLVATPGGVVHAGQPLVSMRSEELDWELAQARASQIEMETRLRAATAGEVANIAPLRSMFEAATNRVAKLLRDQAALTVRAPHDGLWVAPELKDSRGRWLARGTALGILVNPASFQFTATVRQEETGTLFARKLTGAEVRLHGQAGEVIAAKRWQVIPGAQHRLPSVALGWRGGGEMPTAPDDPQGVKSAEPFFEVRAELPSNPALALLHGRSGRIRFDQEWEPLLPRWIRSLRQLMQHRYQI